MLNAIIKDICSYLHIPIIDVLGKAYMQGINDESLTPDIFINRKVSETLEISYAIFIM